MQGSELPLYNGAAMSGDQMEAAVKQVTVSDCKRQCKNQTGKTVKYACSPFGELYMAERRKRHNQQGGTETGPGIEKYQPQLCQFLSCGGCSQKAPQAVYGDHQAEADDAGNDPLMQNQQCDKNCQGEDEGAQVKVNQCDFLLSDLLCKSE